MPLPYAPEGVHALYCMNEKFKLKSDYEPAGDPMR